MYFIFRFIIYTLFLTVLACTGSSFDVSGIQLEQVYFSNIQSSADDAEEQADGSIYSDSSDIELTFDSNSGNQVTGLRMPIGIPQGAIINQAKLRFTVDEVSTGSSNLQISVEDTGNSSEIVAVTNNISGRVFLSQQIAWSPDEWLHIGESGTDQTTSDIADLIQSIVNRDDWQPCNYITISISGSGHRVAVAYDKAADQAAKLIVTYQSPSQATVCGNITLPVATPSLDAVPAVPSLQGSAVTVNPTPTDIEGQIGDDIAIVSWSIPNLLQDGLSFNINNISNYTLYHGMTSGIYDLPSIVINDANATQFAFSGLQVGSHYFALSVTDIFGTESTLSNVVSKKITK